MTLGNYRGLERALGIAAAVIVPAMAIAQTLPNFQEGELLTARSLNQLRNIVESLQQRVQVLEGSAGGLAASVVADSFNNGAIGSRIYVPTGDGFLTLIAQGSNSTDASFRVVLAGRAVARGGGRESVTVPVRAGEQVTIAMDALSAPAAGQQNSVAVNWFPLNGDSNLVRQ